MGASRPQGVADRPGRRLGCPHLRKDRIAKKIDAAFFGNTVSNGPSGLLSLTGINEIDTDAYPFSSLDPVHQAKAAALADGAEITVWVLAPDVAPALSTTKEFNPGETSDATSWAPRRSSWSSARAPRSTALLTRCSTTTPFRSGLPPPSCSGSRTRLASRIYDTA